MTSEEKLVQNRKNKVKKYFRTDRPTSRNDGIICRWNDTVNKKHIRENIFGGVIANIFKIKI